MNLLLDLGTVCLVFLPSPASAAIEPDATTILRQSVEANQRNYAALPHFNFFKVEQGEDGTTRTYDEMMLFGSRYSRLIAINGQPLPPDQQKEEQRRLEQTTQRRASESPADRVRRVEAYERERQRDQLLLNEMTNAFDFTLAGEQSVHGRDAYVLKARPRPNYRAPNARAKVLTGMEGTLWIDKKTLQWARVEAEVIRPVSIEGFLARVQPGTRFELEQAPVSEDLWLPSHFSMSATAKIFFFFSKAEHQDETYGGYYAAETPPNI